MAYAVWTMQNGMLDKSSGQMNLIWSYVILA